MRLVDISFEGLFEGGCPGRGLHLKLTTRNPYPYVIADGERDLELTMLWKHGRFRVEEFPTGAHFKLPADTTRWRGRCASWPRSS